MNINDAISIYEAEVPNSRLQYFCSSCDTDYEDEDTICCGDVLMYHNHNMNTPYDEWVLAGLVIKEYELKRELNSLSNKVQEMSEGSRY
jgi:hypothetical protein